jgi:hypothetical protein
MKTLAGFTAVGLALLVGGLAFSGCSSSDDSGSGGKSATGGSGGSSAAGGSGGSSATGGTGGSAGGACLPEPTPPSDAACNTCQDQAECVCATESAACDNDADCLAIYDCAYSGEDGGVGPCVDLDATGAACEYECIALHPAGKATYLAYEKCVFCTYCTSACGDTAEYCSALDSPPDGGTDASSDASGDAASD